MRYFKCNIELPTGTEKLLKTQKQGIMTAMAKLSQIEAWIERLVEEPFVRLFSRRLLPHAVAAAMARALEDAERPLPDGRQVIPGVIQIDLHPDDWAALHVQDPAIETRLTQALQHLASTFNLALSGTANVRLHPDESVPLRTLRVTPITAPADEATQRLPTSGRQPPAAQSTPQAWLLLVPDGQSFPLTQALVRIGRALDNDLILNDPRVSRYHALMRQRYGRYLLQDLGSRSGSQVNGYPVQEVLLRSGDIISLGGCELIYAENDPALRPSSGTRPITALRNR